MCFCVQLWALLSAVVTGVVFFVVGGYVGKAMISGIGLSFWRPDTVWAVCGTATVVALLLVTIVLRFVCNVTTRSLRCCLLYACGCDPGDDGRDAATATAAAASAYYGGREMDVYSQRSSGAAAVAASSGPIQFVLPPRPANNNDGAAAAARSEWSERIVF
jgi:hypothetical protein